MHGVLSMERYIGKIKNTLLKNKSVKTIGFFSLIVLVGTMLHTMLPVASTHASDSVSTIEKPEDLIQKMDLLLDSIKQMLHGEERALYDGPKFDTGDIYLSGIAWNPTAPLAFVNGKVVRMNDAIGERTVLRIEKECIVLSDKNAGKKVVPLYKPSTVNSADTIKKGESDAL